MIGEIGPVSRSILEDVLKENLRVVFCGTAAGDKSARAGAYYAGPQNGFWEVLFRIRLTRRKLSPHEYKNLLKYRIGLTDLIKNRSGTDDKLYFSESDRKHFHAKIARFRPKALAFNGKRAAQEYFRRKISYGRQSDSIEETAVFVLPSTSAAARKFWDEKYWRKLAIFVAKNRSG